MALNMCFRRTVVSTGSNQYLYVPMEVPTFQYESRIIAPTLPGNDATTVAGVNSTNFMFNIGSQGSTITMKGTLLPLSSSDLPTLPLASDKFVIAGDSGTGATLSLSNSPPSSISGYDLRDALVDFTSNMANTAYNRFRFGWANWNPSGVDDTSSGGGKEYATINSEKIRMWRGQIRSLTLPEMAGEFEQFPYTINFQVGETF